MMSDFELPKKVVINEVGPRDGLQNLGKFIPTKKKIEFVHMLRTAGCKRIEVTSFVSPKWVPQMADAREVLEAVRDERDVHFSVLVPNRKGLQEALRAGAKEVVGFMSASEAHNLKNVNKSVEQSLVELKEIACVGHQAGVKVRANIATAFGCEFQGMIPAQKVVYISESLEDAGMGGITLCDTTAIANPLHVYTLCKSVACALKKAFVGAHFHKKKGMEFANVLAALAAGIDFFDASCGGLGGCPFAPGVSGNIATEDLVDMFSRMGIETGINVEEIKKSADFAVRMQREYYENVCIS
jgi:hydroxymethylglutaryl-CoA lyase